MKLQYFGHIARREGDNLEEIIVQGHVEGKRKRGRQKLRWSDVIKEITGLDVCTASRYAQDRDGWNVIICRSTKGQSWPTGLDDNEYKVFNKKKLPHIMYTIQAKEPRVHKRKGCENKQKNQSSVKREVWTLCDSTA